MKVIVYTSKVAVDDQEFSGTLRAIVASSARNNSRHDITGAMVCHNGRFLQVIEGPDEQVDSLFSVIRVDSRHTEIEVLFNELSMVRHFPEWSMRHFDFSDERMFTEDVLLQIRDSYKRNFLFSGELFLMLLRRTLTSPEIQQQLRDASQSSRQPIQ